MYILVICGYFNGNSNASISNVNATIVGYDTLVMPIMNVQYPPFMTAISR